MPGAMSDDQLNRYFARPDFDPSILSAEEKQRLKTLTDKTYTEKPPTGAAPTYADDSPLDFGRDFAHGAFEQGKDILKGFKQIGGAAVDVAKNVATQPSTIMPTLKGFVSGGVEGAKNLVDPEKWKETQEGFTGVRLAGDENFATKSGRTATNIAAMLLPVKGASMVGRGARALRNVGRVAEEAPSILRGAEAVADAQSRVASGGGVRAPEGTARTPYGHGDAGPRRPFQPSLTETGSVATSPADAGAPSVVGTAQGTTAAPGVKSSATGEAGRPPGKPGGPPAAPPTAPVEPFVPGGTPADDVLIGQLQEEMDKLRRLEPEPGPANPEGIPDDTDLSQPPQPGGDQPFNLDNEVESMIRAGLGLEQIDYAAEAAGAKKPGPGPGQTTVTGPDTPIDDPMTLDELRSMSGSAEAARDPRFRAAAKEAGIPATKDAVQDLTGGPSRTPGEVEGRSLDSDFMRHLMDERGSVQFGPGWDKIKKALGFGGKEPEAISKDPFALKEGPMDRRNFLYRASGTPRKLAFKRAAEVANKPIEFPKGVDRIKKLDAIADKLGSPEDNTRLDTIADAINKYQNQAADAIENSVDDTTRQIINKYRGNEGYAYSDEAAQHASELIPWEKLGDRDLGYSPSVDDTLSFLADAKEMGDKSAKVPSMLEAITGETLDETGKAVEAGASETSAAGTATLDDSAKELSLLDRIKKFRERLSDERGSASIFPGKGGGDVRADLAGKSKNLSEGLDPKRYRYRVWPKEQLDRVTPPEPSNIPPESNAQERIAQALEDYAKKLSAVKEGEGRLGKKIGGEEGFFRPGAMLDVLNQARIASFLSGLAIPKSMLGNIGAITTAAWEGGTTAPLKEATKFRTNLSQLKQSWQNAANPQAISGAGKLNVPGRVMGAFDETTENILKRAGLTQDEARRLLLTKNNRAFSELGLNNPVGRAFFPFQRTASNVIKEGFGPRIWKGSTGGQTARKTAQTLATMGAGSFLGSQTKDPRLLGLAAALSGVRAVPFLIAAGMGGAGKSAVAGLSPVPEWGIPSAPKDLLRLTGIEPAAVRAFGLNDTGGRKSRDERPERKRGTRAR